MGRTLIWDVRTDGLTDRQTTLRLYAPPKFLGKHKKVGFSQNQVSAIK